MLIRASQLGSIMSDERGSTITSTQMKELNLLLSKIKLTDKQAVRRDELQAKKDAPATLSQGAKTYIQKLALYDKYSIEDTIESRYLDKGIICEDEAISLYNSVCGTHLIFKNEEHFKNDYVQGTPDLILEDKIVDTKCSWSLDSFPFFMDKLPTIYYYQLQAYMWLCDKDKAEVAYVLVNTPEHLFNQELEREKWKVKDTQGVLDLSAEMESDIYEELILKHNFDRIPFEKRVKIFEVEADLLLRSKIEEKVKLAREYYNEIFNSL